jgi:hypothetical protein
MPTFEDREKGFEAKFTHDQEQRFKIAARRNRMLGLWAAERLGLAGAEAEAYARQVVMADFEKPGDDDVVGKVVADLKAKGVPVSPGVVRTELEKFGQLAREQMMKKD